MAASYPGAIKTFSAIVNGVTKLVAALFNSPYDEITAIETELGTDPAGSYTDVKARLDAFPFRQIVYSELDSTDTGTGLFSYDDVLPSNTQGDEYMTCAITPKSATNKLLIEALLWLSGNDADRIVMALFQDATAAALKVVAVNGTGGTPNLVSLRHIMVAGTASATTFKIRAGKTSGGTTTFNGIGGLRKFGGGIPSILTITEIQV